MTTIEELVPAADPEERSRLIEEIVLDAAHGFGVLRASGTVPDGGAVTAVERVPGGSTALVLVDRADGARPTVSEVALDAHDPRDGAGGLADVLRRHPDLTTVVHLHAPNVTAWALTGQPLPIRYVPVQRWTLARELAVRTDSGVALASFIDDVLGRDPHAPAVLDVEGGAIVWGRKGLLRTLEYAQLVEEGAQLQLLADRLGGSLPVGPGVLLQQWRMSGLEDAARAEGLLD